MDMKTVKEQKPKILIYGIERRGYHQLKDIETKLCTLHFESFDTNEKFQDYDGVILFKGIFEKIETHENYSGSWITISSYKDELQRRKKQYQLLRERNSIICFLLTTPFIDRDENGDASGTDLAKWALGYNHFHRKNLSSQATFLKTIRNEFVDFLKNYGAACTVFECYDEQLNIKEVCRVGNQTAGIILWNREYFIPTLKPKEHELEVFFTNLADALISSNKKLSEEIPDWANDYRFEEENILIETKNKLQDEIYEIDQKLLRFREYKKCLCYDDELLKESIIRILKDGFGFKVDDTDNLKEDLKIVDNNKPIVLLEVKGTNKGITREYINQADSHRERANLDESFPSILIVNTNIKKSNSLEDKYQEVAKEQIAHAVKMNILILRTIDLLNVLYLKEKGDLSKEDFLDILKKEKGWLETTMKTWKIRME